MKTTTEMQLVPITKLVPYVNNARTHSPEQINKLRSSLREFGFINPVIIDRDYGVIAGHGRILAAKEEGIIEVPCVFADHLTEAQKKAYIIADNRMAMDAGWDEELLRVEIESLQAADFDPLLTGFDEKELSKLFDDGIEAKEDDFDVDAELQMYKIVEIGGNIVKGLWSGITQLASWLWDKVSGWISSIWDGICDFFGIHSPSKEMAWVGEMLVKGLAGSIDDNGDEAVKAAEGMAEDINGVMGDLANDMQTALPTDFDVNGSIRSAVDGVVGKAASAFTIALNITNFNNYSSEDIRQLTSEVMETANQFAQRKGVVFA